jgi:hypothetical protein
VYNKGNNKITEPLGTKSEQTYNHYNILVQYVYLDCTSQKLACTLGTKSEQTYNHYNILVQNVYLDCTSQKLAWTLGTKTEQTYNHYNILVQNVYLDYNLDIRFVPVYCRGCMFVLFLYRVCMLASVMYNLDRRIVPVYCCGCMFVLFLCRVILVQYVYLDCTSQKLACTLGTKTEQTYNHYNRLVQI